MDIDLLAKMVKELILDKDKVVLPGLGTFVAEMVPSVFSDRGYTLNPPYRRLYFIERTEPDTAISDLYAQANDIATEVAQKIITDFLSELKRVLQEKKTVVFPGLGRLRATKENNFFFVPDEDLDIYPEGIGLEPISLKTHEETPEEVSAAVSQLKSIIDEEISVTSVPESISTDAEEPAAESEPEPEPESESESEPEPEPEPKPVQEPKPEQNPQPKPQPNPQPKPARQPTKSMKILKTAGAIAAVILMLIVLFGVLGQMFPGIFDGLLYSKEQLEILNYGM